MIEDDGRRGCGCRGRGKRGDDSRERRVENAGRGVAGRRRRRERVLDRRDERVRQIRAAIPQAHVPAVAVRGFDVVARVAVDRVRVRHEEVEEHAERVDVARWRRRGAEHPFGRQVQRRASQPPRVGTDQRLAGAEVHQHDASAALAHHVVRLQVGVDVSLGVDRDQRAAQLPADGRGFLGAHGAVPLDFGRERPAVDELHPQADAAVRLARAEDPDDVGMPDPREEAPLLEDAALEVGEVHTGIEELQRDDAVQRIEGAVDGAEGAPADGLEYGQLAPRRPLLRRTGTFEPLWIPEQNPPRRTASSGLR